MAGEVGHRGHGPCRDEADAPQKVRDITAEPPLAGKTGLNSRSSTECNRRACNRSSRKLSGRSDKTLLPSTPQCSRFKVQCPPPTPSAYIKTAMSQCECEFAGDCKKTPQKNNSDAIQLREPSECNRNADSWTSKTATHGFFSSRAVTRTTLWVRCVQLRKLSASRHCYPSCVLRTHRCCAVQYAYWRHPRRFEVRSCCRDTKTPNAGHICKRSRNEIPLNAWKSDTGYSPH